MQRDAFAGELVAVPVEGASPATSVTSDEHPRPETTMERLAKLQAGF